MTNNNTAVELQKLRGEIELLNSKFDSFAEGSRSTAELVVSNSRELTLKLSIAEFEKYKREELNPILKWANDRIPQEKLVIGLLMFLGASNIFFIVSYLAENFTHIAKALTL